MVQPNNISGFTLLELIVVVAVVAVLAMIAVPSYQSLGQSSSIRATSTKLVAALNYARTQAIKQDRSIRICGSTDQSTCDGNWSAGWIIQREDGKGSLLSVQQLKSKRVDITFNSGDDIVFDPNGFALGDNGSFPITAGDYAYQTCIIVAQTGRVRTATGKAGKDCTEL